MRGLIRCFLPDYQPVSWTTACGLPFTDGVAKAANFSNQKGLTVDRKSGRGLFDGEHPQPYMFWVRPRHVRPRCGNIAAMRWQA